MFSLILLVKVIKKAALVLCVNNLLQSWCQKQGFGFCDCGMLVEHQHPLGKDGI